MWSSLILYIQNVNFLWSFTEIHPHSSVLIIGYLDNFEALIEVFLTQGSGVGKVIDLKQWVKAKNINLFNTRRLTSLNSRRQFMLVILCGLMKTGEKRKVIGDIADHYDGIRWMFMLLNSKHRFTFVVIYPNNNQWPC